MKSTWWNSMVACAAAVAISQIPAGVLASQAGAQQTARAMYQSLVRHGYSVRDTYQLGLLDVGRARGVRMTLYQGTEYVLFASGCEEAVDVDILVYDENRNLVAGDTDSSVDAIARVTPAWSGPFLVVIRMADAGSGTNAHWVLQTGYQ
jgi:hypothetical protein